MAQKLISDMPLSDFSCWSDPIEMWDRVMKIDAKISRGDLIAGADHRLHKFRETIPASTFAVWFSDSIDLIQVRMRDERALDFELRTNDNHSYEFELVTSYGDGRKPGAEHRRLSDDSLEVIKKVSTTPIDLGPIVKCIGDKTQDIRNLCVRRHLLVYRSIFGGGIDLEQLHREVATCGPSWESIWLIRGVPDTTFVTLLCNECGFKCHEGKWLPNWEWAQERIVLSESTRREKA
jgi:hypothetical protein